MASEDDRLVLSSLIQHMPADGRYQVEIAVSSVLEVPPYASGSHGVTHIDKGMLEFFWDEGGCRSLLDVGCGPGGQVETAQNLGYRALGIEVDPHYYRSPGVALVDLCVQPVLLPRPADLVWSVEVAEHLPGECVANFIETLTRNATRALCLTASQEPMVGHLTLHPPAWWVQRIEATGNWLHDPMSSALIERYSTMQREFLRTTGMIFWRKT
jgi:hypothetical protein